MTFQTKVRRLRRREAEISNPSCGAAPSGAADGFSTNELLGRVTDLMSRHKLPVTGENLAMICDALSGTKPKLMQALSERESSGEPINQRWLDTLARLDPAADDRTRALEKLSDKLEDALARFARSAKSAQDETCDGREALGAQINEFEASIPPSQKGGDVDRVIGLSRAMLNRIEQVETAIERSQAETNKLRDNLAEARKEADFDHLTRLPNRRAFERRFESAAKDARSSGQPLCVAFCDVDHFKSVNDTHGHDAGDRILVAIASTLNEIATDGCFVARHGGEEFVLLFSGLDKEQAWRKLDGARRTMATRQLMNRETGKPFGKITFSAGLAEVADDSDARSALARADEALYQAKKEGRNRVIAI